jgi:hypothetical protein
LCQRNPGVAYCILQSLVSATALLLTSFITCFQLLQFTTQVLLLLQLIFPARFLHCQFGCFAGDLVLEFAPLREHKTDRIGDRAEKHHDQKEH